MSAGAGDLQQVGVVIGSHGWMSWPEARAAMDHDGAVNATWLEPGCVRTEPLPATWPWTSRLHAWGDPGGPLWRVLGDPRREDRVLLTSARMAGTGSDAGDVVEATAVVGSIGMPHDDLCRLIVTAIRPDIGSSVTFVAPAAHFAPG